MNHFTAKLLLFITVLAFSGPVSAQKPLNKEQADALNEYVRFANESVHGMLIAHRLFENYNQDINKFVDLPGHQLNFYSNSDLPDNIFEDPENWFYEVSPSALYVQTLDNYNQIELSQFTPLQQIATEINDINLKTNQLRLSIGESLNTLDLKDKENIYKIYDMLEEAVDQFDLMLAQLINMDHQLTMVTKELTGQSEEKPLDELYRNTQKLLLAVKSGDKTLSNELLTKVNAATKKLQAGNYLAEQEKKQPSVKSYRLRLFENMNEISEMTKDFVAGQPIPEVYDQYGANYYYYNTKLISRNNRYGNGMVTQLNQILAIINPEAIQYLELPHHLKIIYPVKLDQQVPVVASSIREIVRLPEQLEDRKVVLVEKAQEIVVDAFETEIEIFDYLHQDGDIISLNFNGDWIIKELSMESKPKKFILKLNTTGENYLILHAVNEGSIPPNTIGINYLHKGRKKRHLMQSSLKTSQMVRIKVDGKS